jgi:tripartite-type tricarboxylate transporter receptor subunit TctC
VEHFAMTRTSLACVVTLALTGVAAPALAQNYPTRPIRIIVTTSAGGLSDVFLRAVAEPLHQRLGQPVVVENRAGGNMIIGARACAEAAPDGYTLCMMPGEPLIYNQFQYKNLPYDPDKSFAPITNFFFITQALGVSAALPVTSLAELVAYSKAKAGTLSYSAPSSSLIMFMENWKRATGADLVKIPFKGGGDTVNGILSGTTPVGFLGLGNLISYIRAGTIRPILVDSEQRSALIPRVPTLGEIGAARDHTRAFFGLLAPTGTPHPIVEKLRGEIVRTVSDPQFQARHMTERGLEPVLNTPEEFRAFLIADRVNAERIVKAAGDVAQ